jgi:hypothetical protein
MAISMKTANWPESIVRLSNFVLGYHGCSVETARKLLGGSAFLPAENSYDWLGHGIYSWESDAVRAFQWASQHNSGVHEPSLVGAVVDLGNCLDLTTQSGVQAVRAAYQSLSEIHERAGEPMPRNGGQKKGQRDLDCAVINHLHRARKKITPDTPYQSVRALFVEGEMLYENAGFYDRTHVQLCVIDPNQILGIFRVPEHRRKLLGIGQDLYPA